MTTAEFIVAHRTDDPRQLALQASRFPDVDMPYALSQIQGWQKERTIVRLTIDGDQFKDCEVITLADPRKNK